MKKLLWTVVVAVVAVVVFYMVRGDEKAEPLSQTSSSPTPTASAQVSAEPSANEVVVTYTNSGYEPSSLTVKVGTTVTFKNASTHSSWTASGAHPSHKNYPEPGGCLGSKFDACKGIMPGESWSFKFNIIGSWGYHDHLNPSFRGTVIVN